MHRAAALFSTSPEEITARTGFEFEAGVDELDHFRAISLELPSGRRVRLLWHERAPVLGLELDIDLADDLDDARIETMNALGIAQAELIWQPDADASAS